MFALALIAHLACTGEVQLAQAAGGGAGELGGAGSAGGASGARGSAGGSGSGGGWAGGVGRGGGGGAGGCTRGGPLAGSVRRTPLGLNPSGGPAQLVELPGGGAALAFSASGGVQVRLLDASDALGAAGFTVAGDEVLGLAAAPQELALLLTRAPDRLLFLRTTLAGAVLEEQLLIAGGDHAIIGTEWFGEFARTGRLVKTPDGYAAYAALHRRWPDNIGHQGDTLKLIRPDAGFQDAWGWGCSHSGDQRLHHNGSRLGALCLSDCYPQKAIMFNHRQSVVSDEPSGNCAGVYGGELGGLTSDGDAGFMLTYASREGRADWDVAHVHLSREGRVLQRAWLTGDAGDDRASRLARFDGQLLAGWTTQGVSKLQRLEPPGPVEAIPHRLGEEGSDWQGFANGDVVWVQRGGAGLEVLRVRACVP